MNSVRRYITNQFGITDFSGEHKVHWYGRVSEILEGAGDKRDETGHVIAFREWRNDARCNGSLAHEVFHVAENILTYRRITFDNCGGSNEAYAYLIQRLFTTCHHALNLREK